MYYETEVIFMVWTYWKDLASQIVNYFLWAHAFFMEGPLVNKTHLFLDDFFLLEVTF